MPAATTPPPPPAASAPAAGGRTARRVGLEVAIVLAVAGLIAVIVTWPLAANFDTFITGGGTAGDNTGYLWDIWSNANHGLDLWGAGLQEHIGWPFGRTIIGGANLLLFFYEVPAWVLASIFPTIVAYNILTLTGLALAGGSMYLLIRWMGLGVGAAAWAGIAYEIFPYEAQRTAAFPPLGFILFAPLLVMAGIWWIQRPSWRRALLLAGAVLFAWLSNPYYGAMALVGVGVVLGVGAVLAVRATGWGTAAKRVGEAVAFLIVVVGIPLLLVLRSSHDVASAVATRQRVELELYGAHLGDYVKPLPGQYLWSGIFGSPGDWPFVADGGERIAFLGWTTIALAILGLVLAWIRRSGLTSRERIAVFVAIPLAVVAGVFSLASPYPVFGHMVSMPSSLVFDYLPFLRVYARFALMVMVAVLIVAALGLSLLIRGRSITWRLNWVLLAVIFTCMELPLGLPIGTGVPFTVNGMAPEQVPTWNWLAAHDPGAPVIETPAFPNEDRDREFLYGQTIHDHPLANGSLNEPGVVAQFGDAFGNPLFPGAAGVYASAGIKYVVLNPWAWDQAKASMPRVDRPPKGYAVAATFPDGSAIWRVTAPASPGIAVPATGWLDATAHDGARWRWMNDQATYVTWAPRAADATIAFQARGLRLGSRYMLTVTAPSGAPHTYAVVGTKSIRMPVHLPAGQATFHLAVTGTPAAPEPGGGSPEDESHLATIEVSQWFIS